MVAVTAVTATVASAWHTFLLARGMAGIASAMRSFSPPTLDCVSLNRFDSTVSITRATFQALRRKLCATNRGQHAPPLKPERQHAREPRDRQHERDGKTKRGYKADLF